MLPVVSHEVKTRRWPYVTVCLIRLNIIAFGFEASVGTRFVPFLQEWGVVPGRIQAQISTHNLFTVGSSTFLHVGFVHLLGNMWFLYVFGDAVEDAFGPWWYLGLYLASGFFGTMAFVATAGASPLPVIGASGAVSGVMAASLVLWPRARLKTPGILLLLFILGLLYELLVAAGIPSFLLRGPLLFVVSVFGLLLLTRNAGGFFAGLLPPRGHPGVGGARSVRQPPAVQRAARRRELRLCEGGGLLGARRRLRRRRHPRLGVPQAPAPAGRQALAGVTS